MRNIIHFYNLANQVGSSPFLIYFFLPLDHRHYSTTNFFEGEFLYLGALA